jgi:hypothetical protein
MLLSGQDYHTAVRQGFMKGFNSCLEKCRTITPKQQERWNCQFPEPFWLEMIGLVRA